jgi:hypothetical protein
VSSPTRCDYFLNEDKASLPCERDSTTGRSKRGYFIDIGALCFEFRGESPAQPEKHTRARILQEGITIECVSTDRRVIDFW